MQTNTRYWVAFAAACAAVLGCEPPASPPKMAPVAVVRPADVESWSGVPLIDLETHPVFSILPKETRSLSDGTEMWVFTSCPTITTYGDSAYARARCTGGEKGADCCHNQFIVKNGTVVSYRPTGSCVTECRARPQSRPCP